MSMGIVSSKEGHDESHIDDMKLRTKFWNDVNEVTIRLTKSTNTESVLTAKVNFFNFPLNIGRHDKILGSMNKPDKHTVQHWTMHSFERLKGVT